MQSIKKNCLLILTIFFVSIVSCVCFAKPTANVMPLKPEEAFKLHVSFTRPHVLTAEWQIAPHYYLYKSRMKIDFKPAVAAQINYPTGEAKYDEEHGHYEVYAKQVNVPMTLPADADSLAVNIHYQGCSQDGFCYPPMDKNFMVNVTTGTVTEMGRLTEVVKPVPSLNMLLTNQNDVGRLLEHHPPGVLLLIFLGLGLLLAFTPCVLPMIPILTSIIVGQQHAPGTRKAFFLSATYVLGMSFTYALAGLIAASLGSSIQVWLQKPWTIIIVSLVFVLLAFSLFGLYELRFSRRWHNWISNWSNKHEGGTYIGVLCMGVLATLVVSPCVTAPLVGVLIYIGQTGNLWFGASALFVMGLGMGIPLLLIGMSAGKWLPKSGPWMKAVKDFFGIFMLAMAIWLLSRILSATLTKLLFGLLLLGAAAFIGIYLPKLIRLHKLNRMVGLVTALCGVFLMFNAASVSLTAKSIPSAQPAFTIVHNINELNQQLTRAGTTGQPVLLDFYADWCISCVEMDRHVFSAQNVKPALNNFVLLRVDLSNNTADDQALLKQFGVIAPPTVLFFNNAGQEVNSRRIIGELDANEFLLRLDSFITASCDKKVEC